MIKIILADDHNVVRTNMRLVLEKEPDINVIAEAVNGKMALQLIDKDNLPDILLADINMPKMTGLDLLTNLKHKHPDIKVIILSKQDNEKHILESFKAGASGYVLKNASHHELVFAVKHVHLTDGKYICNEISQRLLNKLLHTPETDINEHMYNAEISKREIEVLTLIAEGYTNQEIADKLFTSKRTIEGHRQSIIDKTGVKNTAALVRYAILHGIVN
jgi:DNA-binding NarL/FixJ family response regulator